MNKQINKAFKDFTVDGVQIPVAWLKYEGHGEPYITYQAVDVDDILTADDEIEVYNEYYDFDVYSLENYANIIKALKKKLKALGFRYIPTRSSSDMYEKETNYYHKTLCFEMQKGE